MTESKADDPSTAALFSAVWDGLTDLMGTSATATLLRRAAKHAVTTQPGLRVLVIHKPAFEYEYVVPDLWCSNGNGREELHELMRYLVPLLTELTGSIAIDRLQSVDILAAAGLFLKRQETADSKPDSDAGGASRD